MLKLVASVAVGIASLSFMAYLYEKRRAAAYEDAAASLAQNDAATIAQQYRTIAQQNRTIAQQDRIIAEKERIAEKANAEKDIAQEVVAEQNLKIRQVLREVTSERLRGLSPSEVEDFMRVYLELCSEHGVAPNDLTAPCSGVQV